MFKLSPYLLELVQRKILFDKFWGKGLVWCQVYYSCLKKYHIHTQFCSYLYFSYCCLSHTICYLLYLIIYAFFSYTLHCASMVLTNIIWINYLPVVTYLLWITQFLYVVLLKHYFKYKICLVNQLLMLINKFYTSQYLLSLNLVLVEKLQVISFLLKIHI